MKGLKEEVIELSKTVSEFIREERNTFDRKAVETKRGFSDLVSYVDKQAEQMLVEGLQKLDSSFGFIAEEGTGEPSEEWNWIIDPLDGTTNFIHNLPVFSISIALAHKNELQLGVISDIKQADIYAAEKGLGAWLNDKKITVSPAASLSESLLATGFPYYEFKGLDGYMKILTAAMQQTQGLRRMGSAAIDLAYTAAGKFEGFFEYNLNSWDVAAGTILVREAGGTVTEFNGGNNPVFGRSIVAANSFIHQDLLHIIAVHWKN